MLPRAIDARNRHPGADHRCRLLCGCANESMLHLVTCRNVMPFWIACLTFCRNGLSEPDRMSRPAFAIIFNVGDNNKLLNMVTRAFLRHAVRWWYACMVKVHHEKKIFVWKTCYHITLTKFREAVVRKCLSIRRHYIHRQYTDLTGVVPEEERARYGAVAKIEISGTYTISRALEAEIHRTRT